LTLEWYIETLRNRLWQCGLDSCGSRWRTLCWTFAFHKKMGNLLNTEQFLISFEGFCFMELVYWNLSTLKGLVFVLWWYTTAHFALASCRDTKTKM